MNGRALRRTCPDVRLWLYDLTRCRETACVNLIDLLSYGIFIASFYLIRREFAAGVFASLMTPSAPCRCLEIEMNVVRRLLWDTEGQDLIEYALLAALIGLAVTTAMSSLDGAMNDTFSRVSEQLGS